MSYNTRRATEEDLKFVRSSWLSSYSESAFARMIAKPLYFLRWEPRIEEVLKAPGVVVLMAYDTETPTIVVGYLVWQTLQQRPPEVLYPAVAHYCYVKKEFRKSGVLVTLLERSGLMSGGGFYVSHTNIDIKEMILDHNIEPHPVYDPTLFIDGNHGLYEKYLRLRQYVDDSRAEASQEYQD